MARDGYLFSVALGPGAAKRRLSAAATAVLPLQAKRPKTQKTVPPQAGQAFL